MLMDDVRQCMARALELDPGAAAGISETTTAADLPAWTSVAHLALILELETTFGMTFDNSEIASLGSVSALLQRLSTARTDPS